jgi:hypothetical protein
MVSVCQMSVMSCRFVVTSLMMLGRLFMMSGCVFVVFSGFFVMLRTFMLSHFASLLYKIRRIHIMQVLLSIVFDRITGPLKRESRAADAVSRAFR